MKEFTIHFDEVGIDDLRRRSSDTRLPCTLNDGNWSLGMDREYLLSLLTYWRDEYDWFRKEIALNQYSLLNNAEVAELWYRLMTEVLGYKEYTASGGDMGRGVTCYLAARYPSEVRGIHLTDVGFVGGLATASDGKLAPVERAYKHKANEWTRTEGAYIKIQSTKPQTFAYLLSDSPTGMAAQIAEKYHAWSDWPLLTMDDIPDSLTLYWMTNTACTSIRAYHGNAFTSPPLGKIRIPTAIAAFPYDVLPAPRGWIERNYPVIMYSEMPRGSHFTALEQPEQLAENISQFMRKIF